MRILCDIGGTYVRFAVAGKATPENIRKYEVTEFETLAHGLRQYCADEALQVGGEIRIALAGYHDGDLENFPWIDEAGLRKYGWEIELYLNDFEAAVMALPNLEKNEQRVFRGAPSTTKTACLIGPGTGLGLAYLRGQDVQMTCGGQMAAAGVNNEQRDVISSIQGDRPALPYEELVSGRGLEAIYKACGGAGLALEDFMDNLDNADIQKSLRLFHEFFALFAANAVISGHATGGLYLTGGVMERLTEAAAFDFSHFEKFFLAHPNPLVRELLESVPISHISYSYPALKGLYHA